MRKSAVIGIITLAMVSLTALGGLCAVIYNQVSNVSEENDGQPVGADAVGGESDSITSDSTTSDSTASAAGTEDSVFVLHQDIITNEETEYVLELYDITTNTISEEAGSIPSVYIGCSRERIAEILEDYEASPSVEDLEAGFIGYSLIYFSADKIVLRKNYDSSNSGYKYCIMSERGLLTVYYIDLETVYEYTSIETATLPNDVQIQVISGLYFQELADVFDFLETYSS